MLFLSSIVSPCFVYVFVRCRSDLSALAVLYAHDRYCRGLGRKRAIRCDAQHRIPHVAAAEFPSTEEKLMTCTPHERKVALITVQVW